MRGGSFLGFQRCFIGLFEEDAFHIRWAFENGQARPVDIPLAHGAVTRHTLQKEVFCTEDGSAVPGVDPKFIAAFRIRQALVVPLLGSVGDVLGMFGVLDRVAAGPIDDEDIRRARALAAQSAVALELTRNLHNAEQHRRRAEALVTLALDLNAGLQLREFMRRFALRAVALRGGRAASITLFDMPELETVVMCGASEFEDRTVIRRLAETLRTAVPQYTDDIVFVPAADLLGPLLASSLGWQDCTLVRLAGTSGECRRPLPVDRGAPPAAEDYQLMRALAVHASIALENARLFTRMQQANGRWATSSMRSAITSSSMTRTTIFFA